MNEKRQGSDEMIERRSATTGNSTTANVTENPLARYSAEELSSLASNFAKEHEMEDIAEDIRKGAFLAQTPAQWETMEGLSDDERGALRDEVEHSAF
jgi:hypothetical protein